MWMFNTHNVVADRLLWHTEVFLTTTACLSISFEKIAGLQKKNPTDRPNCLGTFVTLNTHIFFGPKYFSWLFTSQFRSLLPSTISLRNISPFSKSSKSVFHTLSICSRSLIRCPDTYLIYRILRTNKHQKYILCFNYSISFLPLCNNFSSAYYYFMCSQKVVS